MQTIQTAAVHQLRTASTKKYNICWDFNTQVNRRDLTTVLISCLVLNVLHVTFPILRVNVQTFACIVTCSNGAFTCYDMFSSDCV